MDVEYEWPDFFPEDIPPDNSVSADGIVFRLVDDIPPVESDFLMTREEHPKRAFNTDDEILKSYGVSFFSKKEIIQEKKRRYPALAEKKIATGGLEKKMGKISPTSKHNHLTLWKCVGSKPHLFINKKA